MTRDDSRTHDAFADPPARLNPDPPRAAQVESAAAKGAAERQEHRVDLRRRWAKANGIPEPEALKVLTALEYKGTVQPGNALWVWDRTTGVPRLLVLPEREPFQVDWRSGTSKGRKRRKPGPR